MWSSVQMISKSILCMICNQCPSSSISEGKLRNFIKSRANGFTLIRISRVLFNDLFQVNTIVLIRFESTIYICIQSAKNSYHRTFPMREVRMFRIDEHHGGVNFRSFSSWHAHCFYVEVGDVLSACMHNTATHSSMIWVFCIVCCVCLFCIVLSLSLSGPYQIGSSWHHTMRA